MRLGCALLVGWLAAGCYLSHRRAPHDRPDAAPADAPARADTPRTDAPRGPCERLVAGPSVLLEGPGGVTPRLLALDGGELGVVYVTPGGGDPTGVRWERLGVDLARLTGSVLVATDSWTWAEPGVLGGRLALFYGATAAEPSRGLFIDEAGRPLGPFVPIDLPHPEALRPSGSGLFWLARVTRTENAFVLSHLDGSAAPVHAPAEIPLGRYGSGFGVASRPDGSGEVLAYPSEGPSGVRRARVRAIGSGGVLSEERTLSSIGADAAMPVFVRSALEVVFRTEGSLELASLDPTTLETVSQRSFARLDGSLVVATVEGRLVVAAYEGPTLTVLDVEAGETFEIAPPRPGFGGSLSSAVLPGALAIAAGLVDGSETHPWVVRIECAR